MLSNLQLNAHTSSRDDDKLNMSERDKAQKMIDELQELIRNNKIQRLIALLEQYRIERCHEFIES